MIMSGQIMSLHCSNNAHRSLIFIFIFIIACNSNIKNNIDLPFIKREIKWESSINEIETKITGKLKLTFSKLSKTKGGSSYLYLGGNFKGIKTNCWKFIFENEALEAIYIWIVNENHSKVEQTYSHLLNHFNTIAKHEAGRDYDSWLYDEAYYGPPELHDTNIILEKKSDSILIKIMHSFQHSAN
jgi:hypothetical protein